jgi:hypothetical protein
MADKEFPTVVVTGTRVPNASFKISDFKSKVGQLVRPNLFRATLTGYTKVTGLTLGNLYDIDDTFEFRCEKAELPGRTLATTDDAVGGGTAMKLPYDVTYNDMVLSIICSEDMSERVFFENWINAIVGQAGSSQAGLVAYYNEYALGCGLIVEQLDENGKVLIGYEMKDVYPIAITPMNATWEETNTYQRFGVTLAYRYYEFFV